MEFLRARGLRAPFDAAALVRAHPLATSDEGLAQAVEALADAKGPARTARLASLRDFLVRIRALALEPRAAQELWEFPVRPSVRLRGDPGLHGALAPLAIERDLPFEVSHDRRAEMEEALAVAYDGLAGARGAAWEAAQAALAELAGADPFEAAWALEERGWAARASEREGSGDSEDAERTSRLPQGATAGEARRASEGRAPAEAPRLPEGLVSAEAPPTRDPLTEACEDFLTRTDGVANDLGGWTLRRHSGGTGGDLSLHDVTRMLFAPHFASAFPSGEMIRTCRRWADMLRFDLSAGGAIRTDDDDREMKPLGARAVAVDPPHQIWVCILPREGPGALHALLEAVGRAHLRCGPPGDAPPEDLWFSDPGLDHACAALFGLLLSDRNWVRRCAHADLSRDDERGLAVAYLFEARIRAARALASREAHETGLGSRASAASRDLFQRACGAALPPGLALRDVDPWLSAFAELRGAAFAASVWRWLRDLYDEDFWRNPRAAPAMQGIFTRGGRPTLRELWSEIGGAPSLDPLADLLLEACA
jgi:hypothetical protein